MNLRAWDLLDREHQDLDVRRREAMALHFEYFILEYVVEEIVPIRESLLWGR